MNPKVLGTGALRDYWELESEVPASPYPEAQDMPGVVDCTEDDDEKEEDLQRQLEEGEERRMRLEAEAEDSEEVELDEVQYNSNSKVKDFRDACKQRSLAFSGSKKRMLQRLQGFKREQEGRLQLEVASKLFRERERKPVALGQPNFLVYVIRNCTSSHTFPMLHGAKLVLLREPKKMHTFAEIRRRTSGNV